MTVQPTSPDYPARREVDYSEQHDRVTTLFRVILIIPIGIVIAVLTAGTTETTYHEGSKVVSTTSGGITAAFSSRRC
jgi:hypothetical protein